MCGIAGILDHGPKEQLLKKMVLAQAHRGPDANGIYLDPTGVAGLGHNRLSIIDLSPYCVNHFWITDYLNLPFANPQS